VKYFYLATLLLWSAINAMAGVELTAPQPQKGAWYGYYISANGSTLAVLNNADPGTSVVYVYQPTTKNWNTARLVAQLTASDGAPFQSVAVYGDVVLAGAFGEQNSQGAVYGFIEPQGGWKNSTESFTLTASDGAAGDIFGSSVAFSNKTIVVGAPGHKIGGAY
jgi:FG-GAP repeat